ncbi:hypothetical protein C8T65DRAFT_743714 [Cerioporus squamosus]|nr:hypothetical protein C8T65DRAFT_743714 [Cerioporus squamosus]
MAFGSDASPPEEEELVQSLRQLMSPEVPSASAPTTTTSRVRRGLPYYNTWDGAAGASSHTGRRAIATNPVAATPPPAINPVPVTPSAPAAPLSAAPAPPAATPTPAATPVPVTVPATGTATTPVAGAAASNLGPFDPTRDPMQPWIAPESGSNTWYVVTVGRRVGVFDNSHQMRRATDTVKGNSACSASSRNAAIESFVTQLSIPDVVKCYPNA